MHLYNVPILIQASAYIKAASPEEALKIAQGLAGDVLEFMDDEHQEVPICGLSFEHERLPDVSLSGAMTIEGPPLDTTVQIDCVHTYGEST